MFLLKLATGAELEIQTVTIIFWKKKMLPSVGYIVRLEIHV